MSFFRIRRFFCTVAIGCCVISVDARAASSFSRDATYETALAKLSTGKHDEALRLLEQSLAVGNVQSRMLMIDLYQRGIWQLGEQEIAERKQRLSRPNDERDISGITSRALALQYGMKGLPADKLQARALYEKAALAGSAVAMTLLGRLYDSEGAPEIAPDPTAAKSWYRKAVAQSDPQAMYLLAKLYKNEPGEMKKDVAEALRRDAAAQGFLPAIQEMAECTSAECQGYAKKGVALGWPDGMAYQLFHGERRASEYAEAMPICALEEQYYRLQKEALQYSPGDYKAPGNTYAHLKECVLTFGYLPSPTTRQWMLKSERNPELAQIFRLDDFDEKRYPFTHKQRAAKAEQILAALEQEFYPATFGYSCGKTLIGFPDGYDDLKSPSSARDNWDRAYAIAANFHQCATEFIDSMRTLPIEAFVPAVALMTIQEKQRVLQNFKQGLARLQESVAHGRSTIARELSMVQSSQRRMEGAAEAERRRTEENRKWAQDFSNELAALPAKIQDDWNREQERFSAMLRGSTVEEERAKAAAAQLSALSAEKTDTGNTSKGGTSSTAAGSGTSASIPSNRSATSRPAQSTAGSGTTSTAAGSSAFAKPSRPEANRDTGRVADTGSQQRDRDRSGGIVLTGTAYDAAAAEAARKEEQRRFDEEMQRIAKITRDEARMRVEGQARIEATRQEILERERNPPRGKSGPARGISR